MIYPVNNEPLILYVKHLSVFLGVINARLSQYTMLVLEPRVATEALGIF